jgi:hypothetical protein
MKYKGELKTLRLGKREDDLVNEYLRLNPAIESFSQLVRIALMDFIAKRGAIHLQPVVTEEDRESPSFLWDYDLTDGQVREILSGPAKKRYWLVARILEHARFDEVWRYLTLNRIVLDLPHLRMPKKIKEHWALAVKRWRKSV